MALVRDLRDGMTRLDFSLYALEDQSDAGHEGQSKRYPKARGRCEGTIASGPTEVIEEGN